MKEANPEQLEQWLKRIAAQGPTRVIIDAQGTATPPGRAKKIFFIDPDVVFIRDDGWTLGAPTKFAEVARKMWEHDWVAYAIPPYIRTEPMSTWLWTKTEMEEKNEP